MLYQFLEAHRSALIDRCREKVERRPAPRATQPELDVGIPLFLDQLIETLRRIEVARDGEPGPHRSHIARDVRSEIRIAATNQGQEAFRHGYSVSQVVHGYGDLCQSITEIAGETRVPVTVAEFQVLNQSLDDAIADAVSEYSRQRETMLGERTDLATGERLGFLAHELRNFLNTAMLAFAAIKSGSVALDGATAQVLDRSFAGLRGLLDRALTDVRLASGLPLQAMESIEVRDFVDETQVAAALEARTRACHFGVAPVAPGLYVLADRSLLSSAVSNLLQNACKFTRRHSHVSLKAYGLGSRVLIEVEDQCGGLPPGKAETLFTSFEQHHSDRSGMGLGLSIARRAVEAIGGVLSVRDMPGLGCVFTVDLPMHDPAASAACVGEQTVGEQVRSLARQPENKP